MLIKNLFILTFKTNESIYSDTRNIKSKLCFSTNIHVTQRTGDLAKGS